MPRLCISLYTLSLYIFFRYSVPVNVLPAECIAIVYISLIVYVASLLYSTSNVILTTLAMFQPQGKGERRRNRQALSCLPCRQHKLKCDRRVPCQTCCRYQREESCGLDPASLSLHSSSPCRLPRRAITTRTPETSRSYDSGSRTHLRTAKSSIPGMTTHSVRANQADDADAEGIESGSIVLQTRNPTKQKEHQSRLTVSLLPQIGSITSSSNDLSGSCFQPGTYWRVQLLAALPTRNQCDMLVSYFLENINWIHHAIHVPSFRKEYTLLWDTDTHSVDLSWLSLLFIVISESALFVSSDVAQAIGLSLPNVRHLSHIWYTSSRQALHASGFESKPQLVHLQTFLVSQVYWLATKNVEIMNSYVSLSTLLLYQLM